MWLLINEENIADKQIAKETNFEKVVEFNETFGVPVSKEPQLNVFDKNPKLTKLRFDLIKEEVNEVDGLWEKMKIFDKHFKPVINLKYGNPKWSMYGYDKH